jgi:aldehyde:ferredoxin oxidoreductase
MGLKFKNFVPMINSCLGTDLSPDDLIRTGERIWNQERLFNLRAGFDHSHDTLPQRFFEEPISDGPAKGEISKVDEMLPVYHELRGWSHQGEPRSETLEALEL